VYRKWKRYTDFYYIDAEVEKNGLEEEMNAVFSQGTCQLKDRDK